MSDDSRQSYRQILKSSVLIGGSSVISVILAVVRTKVLALLVGTAGIGLLGALNSVTTLISGIAGMGMSTSGVRQIAEAVGSGDRLRIARTAHVLRRTSVILGTLGMLVMLVFYRQISAATFGSQSYAGSLALLSVTIFFTAISGGQIALVQGMRRIRDLAALNIGGALLATGVSIPVLYAFGVAGIVPFLVTVSALTMATSWWFARKVKTELVQVAPSALWKEARTLLVMGAAFMVSGLMTSAVAYLTRVLIIRQMDLHAAGLYQAAWNLSTVYAGFVLTAMGADFYPRLTAVAGDHLQLNRLVNEQTESALLMALPGVLGTLTFAPWVISIFYSHEFVGTVDILRWQVFGIFGRVLFWPLGYVLLAKGCAKEFIWTECLSNLAHIVLIWCGLKWSGLPGLGMAFAALYLTYGLMMVPLVGRLTGFVWTGENRKLIGTALAAMLVVFGITVGGISQAWSAGLGGLLTLAAGLTSIRKLGRRMGFFTVGEMVTAGRGRLRHALGRTDSN